MLILHSHNNNAVNIKTLYPYYYITVKEEKQHEATSTDNFV